MLCVFGSGVSFWIQHSLPGSAKCFLLVKGTRTCVCVGIHRNHLFLNCSSAKLNVNIQYNNSHFMIQNLANYIWRIRNGMPKNVIYFAKFLQCIPPLNHSGLNVDEPILTVHHDLLHYTGTCHPDSSYARSSYARMQSVQLSLFLYKHQ